MDLLSVRPGKRYRILTINDGAVRNQASSLGMGEGEEVYCCARHKKGPVILARSGQLVAVGGNVARSIQVEKLPRK